MVARKVREGQAYSSRHRQEIKSLQVCSNSKPIGLSGGAAGRVESDKGTVGRQTGNTYEKVVPKSMAMTMG